LDFCPVRSKIEMMSEILLFNSLSRTKERFEPLAPPKVGMYACGPTVYDYQHIGNMRRYVGDDILKRVLFINGFQVKHVMNITDVGHLTSDADSGEDKMEKAAKQKGESAWDIAKFYEENFFEQTDALNIKRPDIVCKATDHIKEQIELIKKIEEKGLTYKTEDGIYFDTTKLSDYGKLTGGKKGIKPGARVDVAGKKAATDFALWKLSPKDSKRQMEWDSPWGMGFPGWHIECSAMSMKYLGESFDIHTGGVDHIPVHHTNEIAQAESATGKPFVKYWIHHEFLQVDGQKMAKSLGNTYTVSDVEKKGFDPMALRYLFLTSHYRDPMNFTWDSLSSAATALSKLKELVASLKQEHQRTVLSAEKGQKLEQYQLGFEKNLFDDLNTPQALATLWEMLKSNIPSEDKYDLAISFDEVLGLGLSTIEVKKVVVPDEILKLVYEREELRREGKFSESDEVRKKIEQKGFRVEDSTQGAKIKPVQNGK